MIVVFYAAPFGPWPLVAAGVGAAQFFLFLIYLAFFRRDQRGSLGSSVPTILGPLLAQGYVRSVGKELTPALTNGGDTLIQLAFFFAGLIGLIIYVLAIIQNIENQGERLRQVKILLLSGFIFLIVIATVMIAFGSNFAPLHPSEGPPLIWGIEGPSFTGLTVCRALLALWTMFIATTPPRDALQT